MKKLEKKPDKMTNERIELVLHSDQTACGTAHWASNAISSGSWLSPIGRSILAVFLATILAISRMSNNPTRVPVSHCLSSLLHAIAAA